MTKILLGSHVSMAKPNYLLGSAETAISFNENCFMIYTGAPQNSIRAPLENLMIAEFHTFLKEHDINIDDVVVHAPYIINIASDKSSINAMSYRILLNEVQRTTKIGCKHLILHPGNAINISKEEAIRNIAKTINRIHQSNHHVTICLETMSDKGSEVGGNFQELASIIQLVKNKQLIGVCLDTCHINDAGLDVHDIQSVLSEFDKIIGLHYLKVIHLNDSKNARGAKKDRHENIGYGKIGFATLLKYVHEPKLAHIPKILETPYWNNKPLYKEEIALLKAKKWNDYRY